MQGGNLSRKAKPPGLDLAKYKELKIPVKPKTAANIRTMNSLVVQKQQELRDAQANLQNHIVPLLTERGLPDDAIVHRLTDETPAHLVILIPKK